VTVTQIVTLASAVTLTSTMASTTTILNQTLLKVSLASLVILNSIRRDPYLSDGVNDSILTQALLEVSLTSLVTLTSARVSLLVLTLCSDGTLDLMLPHLRSDTAKGVPDFNYGSIDLIDSDSDSDLSDSSQDLCVGA
jgi:hypothetical protein